MNSLPATFTARIQSTFGQSGKTWLKCLPALLNQLAERWSLTLSQPFPDMSYNYVTRARLADGTPAVLKVGVPNPELTTEIAALRHFNGEGSVQLLEADPEAGALLLECIEPGDPVFTLNDDALATSIAARLMGQLHRPPPEDGPFRTIACWGKGLERLRSTFNGDSGPFPDQLVDRAERLLVELSTSQAEAVLLHADLHHWNILTSQRSDWLAIDPKGLIGEREYEAGAWLRNPIPLLLDWSNVKGITHRRLDQFVDLLGLDRQRMISWGLYQAILAAWWSFEEANQNFEGLLGIAELLATIE